MKKRVKIIEYPEYRGAFICKEGKAQTRLMIGVPMTGLLRSEWVMSRYSQIIPCNWSQVELIQWVDQYSPLNFQVADARNVITTEFVERGFEWLLFIDHDVILPATFFSTMNEYMLSSKYPIVNGLYFTKSVPSEPLLYRGRGNSYFQDWKLGDKVWVDGCGLGASLIHKSIMKVMYDMSEEYSLGGGKRARKIFDTPTRVFYDEETRSIHTASGTEDLEFYSNLIKRKVYEKAGWPSFQKRKWPVLVDTKQFCWHIDWDGNKFPMYGEITPYLKIKKDK